MTVHIGAKENEIAETVLMPGDPLRAKFIAEKMLDNVHCYNQVRGMLGFTGTYKGKRVSIQGSGMGMPSMSIYATELITSYGAKNIIRIGSCGALQDQVNLRDIVIAQGACTDSSMNRIRFDGMDYAPIASFDLLHKSYQAAVKRGIRTHVGNIVSSDIFYDEKESWRLWAKYGVLAVDMEAAALYTLGARYGVNTLTILTVSDQLIRKEACTAEERQNTFTQMVEVALELA